MCTASTSIRLKWADEKPPYIKSGSPRTIPILNILVPIILPRAISNSPFLAATTVIVISGSDVPITITVIVIILVLTFNVSANILALSTTKSLAIVIPIQHAIESNIDVEQFVTTIHRYVQIGIYVKGYMSKELGRFQREILEVCEFYVDEHNKPQVNTIYKKTLTGDITMNNPTKYLRDYLGISGIVLDDDIFKLDEGAVDTKAPVGSIETL